MSADVSYETRQHVERELWAYRETKRELERRRSYLAEGGDGREPAEPGQPRRQGVADPTGFLGTLVAEDRQLREMRRIVWAIEDTRDAAPLALRAFLDLYYLGERTTIDAVGEKLSQSRATLFRMKRHLICAVAGRLGWQ